VYKITLAGKITVLHTFAGPDGEYPLGILVQGPDGNFYGTTSGGGASGANGVVFKITPTGTYTLIHSFIFSSQYLDAQIPYAGLTLGTDGNFYGTTAYGGTENYGAIFKITPAGKESVLYSFCSVTCADGFDPRTPLVLHTNGKFYGNTYGNSDGGAVFYSFDAGFKPLVNLVTWSAQVGKTVEILGQGFKGTTAVSFNGTAAKSFTAVSENYLTAVVPSDTIAGLVTVTTPGGTLTSNRKFIVQPFIGSFSPPSGPVGTPVTIAGTSFTGATKVTFGGVKTTKFTVNSDIKITATVPTGAKTGRIQVTTPGGTATSATDFTVTQ
jgi:uncharacterized repeat protein (TIGR03803 family)